MPSKKPDTNPGELPQRPLDLVDLFSEHAKDLVSEAKRGKKIHRTGNIAESGVPFESAFRKIFCESLPSTISACSGFFFDKTWLLSNQVDIMLCDTSEILRLPPSPSSLTQHYLPVTSLHVFGQLKNSATKPQIAASLKQNALSIRHMRTMRAAHAKDRIGLPYRAEPISVVVLATGGSPALVEKALAELEGNAPTYILLLEKGLLFARPYWVMDIIGCERTTPHISFDEYRNNSDLKCCKPDGPQAEASGRALMWLFFALLHKIGIDSGNTLAFGPLVDEVQRKYPLLAPAM